MSWIFRIIAVLLVAWGCWCPAQAQRFTEVGRQAGVADSIAVNGFVAWGDFDGDGDLDLYVTNVGITVKGSLTAEGTSVADSVIAVPNRLYRNNGDGTFIDVAASAGVIDNKVLTGPAGWGDFDNDGDLDLYVVNFDLGQEEVTLMSRLYQNNGCATRCRMAGS